MTRFAMLAAGAAALTSLAAAAVAGPDARQASGAVLPPPRAEAPAPAPVLSPGEIAAQAPAADWIAIAADDLLVMDLAPGARGQARRVVIQLMPPPFAVPWVANIRTLAAAHWWDGLSVVRVQDNYVAQWGDPDGETPARARPLPPALRPTSDAPYQLRGDAPGWQRFAGLTIPRGTPAGYTAFEAGWPVAAEGTPDHAARWPVHCYGMVGVGRNLAPDRGTGAELYAVIGHAPRHLDRNIALVGRVVEGIEHLSSLPRGTGPLGFYADPAERVAIRQVRLASALPAAERPRLEYLSTDSAAFLRYAEARANRRDAFFNLPAGGADICNIPVPVRRAR
ncbi:peptidylprolyl isomerase [Sphingomonas changnyeongensis]|uniref:Peptidylprolyl isomerase n=1 Tax=Sphingomonas changnyeongensis TaxID=2698679 RepID=A0A7Z2SAA7_9SPHN|nr:peptidylprolyl isomerase [Sphingomonas changnyeongensis]QHL91649.1 peptidylprolyl isomerase [Sphingomonas changnyeongensis]